MPYLLPYSPAKQTSQSAKGETEANGIQKPTENKTLNGFEEFHWRLKMER